MSRTPIRQILQRLAYEGLVQTRSGVGNVVVALRPEDRKRDFLTHKGLLQAALLLDMPQMSMAQHSKIIAVSAMAPLFQDDDADTYYDIRNQMYEILASLFPDPILRDAYSASHWRTIRRHMSDFETDPAQACNRLRTSVAHISSYEARNPAALFQSFIEAEFPVD